MARYVEASARRPQQLRRRPEPEKRVCLEEPSIVFWLSYVSDVLFQQPTGNLAAMCGRTFWHGPTERKLKKNVGHLKSAKHPMVKGGGGMREARSSDSQTIVVDFARLVDLR